MVKIKKILKEMPKQLKSSIVILISTFINSAMNFITIPIFTRLMSVEEYGLTAQYTSWLSIITVFATLSLSAGVYEVAMNEYPNDRDRFTFSAMILSNICTCIVFAIIFLFNDYFVHIFHLNNSLIILMFAYLLFYPSMSMWLARQRYEYNYKKVACISIGSAVLSQLSAVISVLLLKNYNLGEVKLFSTQCSMIIFSICIYISIAHKSGWKPKLKYITFALSFNLPLLVHYLAQYVLRSTDKIMITNFIGESATGIYSLATTVANISMLAWTAMSASLTPYIYNKINEKKYKDISRAVIMVEIIFSACCVMIAIIGPEIIYVLGSEKYMKGIYLIPPIAASSLLAAVYSFYSIIAFYYHKTVSTAVMTIIAACVNVVLNIVMIPKFGFVAAAYTTEIAYLLYTILHFINYRIIVGKDRIYNDRCILGIMLCTTIMCIGSGFLYRMIIVRYSLILIIIVICLLKKNLILNTIKMLVSKKDI